MEVLTDLPWFTYDSLFPLASIDHGDEEINSQAPVMGATSIPFFCACGDDANICQPEADLREGTILAVNASCHLLVLVSVSAALYFMSAIHVDMKIYWYLVGPKRIHTKLGRNKMRKPTCSEGLATFIVSAYSCRIVCKQFLWMCMYSYVRS